MKRSAAGNEYTVAIDHLVQSGEGGARVDGKLVLVRGVMPGERVAIRLQRGQDARLLRVLEPSSARIAEPCPYVAVCGGCSWQHIPAEIQRDARLDQLQRALPATLRGLPVAWHAAPEAYGYRTRARLLWETAGRTTLGFRAYHSHDVVDVARCAVLHPTLDAGLGVLRDELHAVAGAGEASLALGRGGIPVVALRPKSIPGAAGFGVPERLLARGFAGASLLAPGASVAASAGDPRPVIRGADGVPLWLAPEGFAQANEMLNLALVEHVVAMAKCDGRSVLELYAGAGNFTVILARAAARVVAVESDGGAVRALAENLRAREIANVTRLHDDSTVVAAARSADIVVLDPPRGGARDACVALAAHPPRRVVYVSCDPPSLGRDLGVLARSMEIEQMAAFEMFPQTPHLEVVVTLHRIV